MNITNDEIKKLAHMSRIAVTEAELTRLRTHLSSVLGYAARVQDIARESDDLEFSHDSRLRADESQPYNARLLIVQAPESQEDLFVVPKIL